MRGGPEAGKAHREATAENAKQAVKQQGSVELGWREISVNSSVISSATAFKLRGNTFRLNVSKETVQLVVTIDIER